MDITPAQQVRTAPLTAVGLIGGFVAARMTGVRPLGGAVMGAAGVFAARTWLEKTDPATTAALAAIYVGGMGASHPLAKVIGPWPSVLAVSALSGAAAHVLCDAKDERRLTT